MPILARSLSPGFECIRTPPNHEPGELYTRISHRLCVNPATSNQAERGHPKEQQFPTLSTKMDLGELEQDEKLYRASPELLLDFKTSLGSLLWTASRSGQVQIRRRVRVKDTDRLVGLVELQFPHHARGED